MITEKDFQQAMAEQDRYEGYGNHAFAAWELAKRMAIEFAEWIRKNQWEWDFDGCWENGYKPSNTSDEQLFELYQNTKEWIP
jgi:hypothetical protein